MSEIAVLLQAALFQLQVAVDAVEEPFAKTQLRLAVGVLASAIGSAAAEVNARVVNDIEFAMNDVIGAADTLAGEDAERIAPAIAMLSADVAALKLQTELPADVTEAIAAFRGKLRTRRTAIERQTFVEGAAEPLPHDPEELQRDALPLRGKLAAAGFDTPALDSLIADPSSFRFHSIGDVLDELEVITG